MMMLLQVGLRAAPHAQARRERAGARSSGNSGCSASSKREVALEEFLEVPAALGPLLVVHSLPGYSSNVVTVPTNPRRTR
eukprot:38181-Rhodomonas_salina.1